MFENLSIQTISKAFAKMGGAIIGGQPYGVIQICNKTGSSIAAGKLVYISGFDATLELPTITLADADTSAKVAQFVTKVAIANNAKGLVYEKQEIGDLNTNGASAVGDLVYLSATAGGWSLSAPSGADQIVQIVGFVTVKSATVGKILFLLQPRNVTVVGTSGVQGGTIASLTDPVLKFNIYCAGALAIGDLLHIVSYEATENVFIVEKADGDNKPAQLIASAINAGGATSEARLIQELTGLNTNAGVVGDPVYLDATTAGNWTLTAPTGANQLAQIVGRIKVKSATVGKIVFNLTSGFEGVIGQSQIQNLIINAAKIATDAIETAKIKDENVTFAKHPNDDKHSIFVIKGTHDIGASEAVDTDLGTLGFKGTLIAGFATVKEVLNGTDASCNIILSSASGGNTPIAETVAWTKANQNNAKGGQMGFAPLAAGIDLASTDHIYIYTADDVGADRSTGILEVFLVFMKSA